MSDTVLNQILHQLQALQVSQQALQAKVRRTIDASGSGRDGLTKLRLTAVVYRSTVLSPTVAFQTLRVPCLAFREPNRPRWPSLLSLAFRTSLPLVVRTKAPQV